MSESNDEKDFYDQWVGEGAAPRPQSTSAASEPTPEPTGPAESAPLDPDGHTQIVDREQFRRDLDALRRRSQDGPAGAVPPPEQDPDGPTAPYISNGPGPGYQGEAGADRGRHTLPPPPPSGRIPQGPHGQQPYPGHQGRDGLFSGGPQGIPPAPTGQDFPSGPAGYGVFPPPGAPVRRGLDPDDAENAASVGAMRAQIHESQVAAPYKPVPETGWRHGLYKVTRINVGLSASEAHWNDLRRRLKVNLRGKYVIAVMQGKGGVNKTTTTVILGAALAKYRDEKIVAIDANPAKGNLARRIDQPSTMSWRGLNRDRNLRDYSDFREYLGKDTHSGLEVLGSDKSRPSLTGPDLVRAWSILQVQYPIAIVDCGNQQDDDITRALLEHIQVDAIVVPSTTRLDGAQGAADTLNWLLESGYPHLVREAVVIVSNINKINASAQVRQLHADFERTVRSVHDVGFDQHLSDAVAIEFGRLQPDTQLRYIEAAASLADGFARAADRAPGGARAPRPAPPQGQPWSPGGGRNSGQWSDGNAGGGPRGPRQ